MKSVCSDTYLYASSFYIFDTICISIIYPRYHFLAYITRNLFNEFFSLIGERSDDSSRPIFLFALFNVPLGFTVIHCINFRLKRNHRLSGRYYTGISLGDASKKRTNIPVGLAGARRISRFHDFKLLCMCVCREANELYIVIFTIILHGSAVKCQLIIECEKLQTRNNFW